MPKDTPPATRQEVVDWLLTTAPTKSDELEWKPLLTRNIMRLRMNATPENASEELIDAYRTARYPDSDIPEIRGLLRVLEEVCRRAGLALALQPGTRELITGLVGYFEPHKIGLPFERATLSLTIAPGEFQWVVSGAKKERAHASQLESLMRELLVGTREWLRQGNRYEGSLFA